MEENNKQKLLIEKIKRGLAKSASKNAGAQLLRAHRYAILQQKFIDGEITSDELSRAKAYIAMMNYNQLFQIASVSEKLEAIFANLERDENTGTFNT